MLSGIAYVAVRKLSKTEHILTILVWFPLATIPLSLIATRPCGRAALPKTGAEIAGHLLVFAIARSLGQATLTEGLARAGAARATAVTMTGPVFGLLFGVAPLPGRPRSGLARRNRGRHRGGDSARPTVRVAVILFYLHGLPVGPEEASAETDDRHPGLQRASDAAHAVVRRD